MISIDKVLFKQAIKRYSLIIAVFLTVALPCFIVDTAYSSHNQIGPKAIRVVMDNNYPPYTLLDKNGILQGITVDQWRLWEQKTGVAVAISGMDWGEALSRMEAGDFDVIDTLFFNDRRAEIYDFSKPYAKIETSIFFHESISGISDVASLQGFAVAVKSGDAAIDYLRGKGISALQEYPSYESIIKAAKGQKVMITVIDNPPAHYFLHKTGIQKQFRYSSPLYTNQLHRAVRKGNKAILRVVEEGFTRITDSEYQAINRKWFGSEMSSYHLYYRQVAAGLVIFAILALMMIAWNLSLRKKVRERTVRLEEEITLNRKDAETLQEAEKEIRSKHTELSAAYQQLAAYDIEIREKYEELTRSKQELTDSEEKYRKIFENAMEGIYQSTPGGRFIYVNPAMAGIFGYDTPDDLVQSISNIAVQVYENPDDRKQMREMLERYGHVENFETMGRCKDGSIIWVSINARRVCDDEGNSLYYEGLLQDITKRKWAEEELKESQRRFSDIIEFLPDATLVIDEKGKVIAWNKAMVSMTGVEAEDMIGKGDYEYAIPFYGNRRPILVDHVLQPEEEYLSKYDNCRWDEGVLVAEAHIPNLKGQAVYLLGTASRLLGMNGSIIGAIETIRDITGRKLMEEALHSERNRFAAILDNIPMATIVIDEDRNVAIWNKYNEMFTGKSREEMIGKRLDLGFLYKDKASPALADIIIGMTDAEIIRKFSSKGVHESDVSPGAFECVGGVFPQSEERTMAIQAARITDLRGKVVGAIQTAQDITEGVRGQAEREKLQRQLVQAQKMEAIGTLAGGIAHDFNNILGGVIGYAELCRKTVIDRPKAHQFMEQVLRAADRAKELVQQILTFSRKTEQEKSPFLISSVIEEVISFLRATLPTTIEIRQKIMAKSDLIMGDATKIHQVMMNLCTNAWHAMRETGGILEIGLEEVVIDKEDSRHYPPLMCRHYLELSVRDTGHGIQKEKLDRIFDPYFTTKDKGEGTGLGLAIVLGIVKDHEGEVRVYSEVGKGTIFKVYLPLLKTQEQDKAVEGEIILERGTERILFIDDEQMLADLSKESLEELGYEVHVETDPVHALEVFRKYRNNFDLVITDKTMPRMTGFEVAREIKMIRGGMPIILCSGFHENDDTERILTHGISKFIVKPIGIGTLSKAIREVLQ